LGEGALPMFLSSTSSPVNSVILKSKAIRQGVTEPISSAGLGHRGDSPNDSAQIE
jgi:hypothetical protein